MQQGLPLQMALSTAIVYLKISYIVLGSWSLEQRFMELAISSNYLHGQHSKSLWTSLAQITPFLF